MRRFNITVNGVTYDVAVEEVGGAAPVVAPTPVAAPAAAPVAAAPVAAPTPAAAPAPIGNAGAVAIKAPMPGTIVKMNVSAGAAVKKGDVLCVLEAMKMENDICAPQDGTVATVNVQSGSSVQTDEVLVTLN
jgi:biotin carboxyl carrier protein